jgi:hypothetical protein
MNATVEQIEQLPAVSTPMQMLQLAVDRGATIDVLAKLMDLQERVDATQARREFDSAFAAVKSRVGIVKKTGIGHNRMPYATLADIAEALDPVIAEQGLSYRFRSNRVGGELIMTCVVCHRAGHFEENSLPAPLDTSGSKNAVQAVGSTSTYLMRYSLMQAFGLSASVNGKEIHDDDGAGADKPDGWARGSAMEDGDYAPSLPGNRAKGYQEQLGKCATVADLDAAALSIEQDPAYNNLPQELKNEITKSYAQSLSRIKRLAPKTYSKKAGADAENEKRMKAMMDEIDQITQINEPLDRILVHLHDWHRERGIDIVALGDTFEAKLRKFFADTLAVVGAEIDRIGSKKPEPAPPPEHKPNGIAQRAIEARENPPRLKQVYKSDDGSFFDSVVWLQMLTEQLNKAAGHEDFAEIKNTMLLPAKGMASNADWDEGARRYYARLKEQGSSRV